MKRALILVDIQNDFIPGGALAVADGDAVLSPANRLAASGRFDLVLATQDWHPPEHGSFAANHPGRAPGEQIDLDGLPQILWPVHCVQNTTGAELASGLDRSRIDHIFQKGVDPRIDSYSGLYDNGHRRSTGLSEYLRAKDVEEVVICGIATDYCVKFTALDARRDGFRAVLVEDACRGVELVSGDIRRAIENMRGAGVQIVSTTDELLR